MAIIKLGATVVGIRGTVDGLTFSANGSGPYVKGWARGPNPKSPRQTAQRNALAEFASAWRNLSPANQALWDAYGAAAPQELFNSLGESYFVTGFSWFIRINLHLKQVGAAQRDIAPLTVRPLAPVLQHLLLKETAAAANSEVRYFPSDPALGDFHTVFIRLFNSIGRLVAAHNFTFIKNAVPDAGRRIFIQTELETAFGEILPGQKAFLTTRIQDGNGQRGPEDTTFADATNP